MNPNEDFQKRQCQTTEAHTQNSEEYQSLIVLFSTSLDIDNAFDLITATCSTKAKKADCKRPLFIGYEPKNLHYIRLIKKTQTTEHLDLDSQ
jgi:hypothetical protein